MGENSSIEKCHRAMLVIGFKFPHFLIPHAKIKHNYMVVKNIPTMAMTKNGRILINEDFVSSQTRDELAGVIVHEILHLVLAHHTRVKNRDMWTWNIATDMCINAALKTDGISLPKEAVYPPNEYEGDLYAEAVYDWLSANKQHIPQNPNGKGKLGGVVMPCGGCSIIDDPYGDVENGSEDGDGAKSGQDWKKIGSQMRAVSQSAGSGSKGIAALLAPRQPKISWKKIIRSGFQKANSTPGREYQTFSRRHRRSPARGVQFPGWIGSGPSVAISIDVSGSMSPAYLSQIVSEVKHLLRQFPTTECYLNTHTSEVVWSGWVSDSTTAKVEDSVQYSGGTDPVPAYEDIRKQNKKFDTMIHFTDSYFGCEWPTPPAKRLIVGLFVREIATKPPPGSMVIMCDMTE